MQWRTMFVMATTAPDAGRAWMEEMKMILDILNLLALIEWIALGVVVWLKARSLYRRSKAVLDALQSEEMEVYEDDAEAMP